jgi:DNA-directed RNA polymerase specialized sigma24 family protein
MSFESFSTHEVLLKLRGGNVKVLGALYGRYAEPFYRMATGKGLSHEEAEDAISTTFVRILERIGTYDEAKKGGESWVWQIHANVVTSLLRERGKTVQNDPPEVTEIEDDWAAEAEKEKRQRCQDIAWNTISEDDRNEIRQRQGRRGRRPKVWHEAVGRLRAVYVQCMEGGL